MLRDNGSDNEVWDATFNHLYHVPPVDISPKSVLDLGANIGLTAAHYAVLWPDAKITAVEMDRECAELARVNAPGCEVLHCAVDGSSGKRSYDSTKWPSNFSLSRHGDTVVDTFSLPFILNQQQVDFVKMDVEGAEWRVLSYGGWARYVKSLLIELHGIHPDEVLVRWATDDLEAMGYTVTRHPKHPRSVWATR